MKVIYCAGEQGRVVLDILRRSGEPGRVVFLDDDPALEGVSVDEVEVIGSGDRLSGLDPAEDRCIVAFGDERGTRIALAERVREAGLELFTAQDSDATVSERATLGRGNIVNAKTYVGPGARLDDLVLLDSAVNVSHDVDLATGVTVGPNATLAGGVTIGRDSFVGAGATVLDDVEVGERAVVGAGAVVIEDVPEETTVVGVPARPIGDGHGQTSEGGP